MICCLVIVLLSLTPSKGQSSSNNDDLPWYVWFVLAIALAIAIILIGLTGFYVLNVCKKIFGVQTSSVSQLHSVRDDSKVEVIEDTDIRVETTPMNLQDDLVPTDKKGLEIPRDNIKILQQLGIGEYGPVYDAEIHLQVNVKSRALVKVFQQGSSQDLIMYRQELESLVKLKHNRVAQLFGVVSNMPYYCVLELPVNGDLKTFLLTTKNTNTQLTLPQLLAMATDTAAGLAYLESIEYIHQDIATRNCVVTQSLGIKIADYKVGRYLFRSEYAVQADGSLMPVRWMAPESLMENHFSLQTDIWSFGVLLWEILTKGQFPFAELSDGEVVQGVCYEFQRLLQPISCPDNVYKIMLKCWHSNPAQRPHMDHLHHELQTSILPLETLPSPPTPPPIKDPGIPANHLN